MKKLLLLSLCCLFGVMLFAQSTAKDVVADFTANVALSETQKKQVTEIEKAFFNDWKEVSLLKESNPELYYNKLSYLKEVKMGKVTELLSDTQMSAYRTYRKAKSVERAAMYKKLQSEGLPARAIKIQMMEEL